MRNSKGLRALLGIAIVLGIAGWLMTWPSGAPKLGPPDHTPDPENGARVFSVAGCASCHATPGAGESGRLMLGGGLELPSPFGLFRVPNISSHAEDGIGSWTELEFLNAMQRGVSPEGQHYYPSFPYSSYARMSLSDIRDLWAFLTTLPPVEGVSLPHELEFPFSVRRGVGLWKRLYLRPDWVRDIAATQAQELRGRYLVEGPGHCGECHTPRDSLGGLEFEAWLSGAPSMDGEGRVPAISQSALADWPVSDLVYYFESGMDPEFDMVGGSMVEVQENLARLPREDLEAIAAYLKAPVVSSAAH